MMKIENGKWKIENVRRDRAFTAKIFNFQFSIFNFSPAIGGRH